MVAEGGVYDVFDTLKYLKDKKDMGLKACVTFAFYVLKVPFWLLFAFWILFPQLVYKYR